MSERQHHTELDGIRGIAILLVMMTHFVVYEPWSWVDRVAIKVAGAGWMGVDVFFVLSGFLITGILFDTRDRERYLSTFFIRRALRIFPLYFAFLFGVWLLTHLIAPEAAGAAEWRDTQLWYWTYNTNFLVARYEDWQVLPLATGHLWSLAIEEQFYLLWPFVVWRPGRHRLLLVCAGVCVGALLLRATLRAGDVGPLAIFVATPTRLDALLLGGLAALLMRGTTAPHALARLAAAAAAVGGVLAGAALLIQLDTHPYGIVMQTAGFSGIALVAVGIVLGARTAHPATLLRRCLRSRVLVFFGTYSYGLYVLHKFSDSIVLSLFPAVDTLPAFSGVVLPWVLLRAACSGTLAVAMALVSWRLLERPFLALKPSYGSVRRTAIAQPCESP